MPRRPDAAAPAEPTERDAIASAALRERTAELGGGESPNGAGAPHSLLEQHAPRDVEQDKAHLAAVAEVLANAGARLAAWRWPALTSPAAAVVSKAQGFGHG